MEILMAGYNRGLFSVSLAGWPCRVSQTLEEIAETNGRIVAPEAQWSPVSTTQG